MSSRTQERQKRIIKNKEKQIVKKSWRVSKKKQQLFNNIGSEQKALIQKIQEMRAKLMHCE